MFIIALLLGFARLALRIGREMGAKFLLCWSVAFEKTDIPIEHNLPSSLLDFENDLIGIKSQSNSGVIFTLGVIFLLYGSTVEFHS